jgi:deoxyribodipyrimidine photolyase-like uncharacterized protein
MKLFTLEQQNGMYTDYMARCNYQTPNRRAVRVRLSRDHGTGEWSLLMEQEETPEGGDWQEVTDKLITEAEAHALLALTR